MYTVKILADSISHSGKRITTFELTYPRFVHAELLTHKMLSKNSASSRAIPVKKMMDAIRRDPVEPVHWGKNQSGMQANEELTGWRKQLARKVWLLARYGALAVAWLLMKIGVHKQLANRVTEPWMFITVILTATEFDNWFRLRDSEMAQPEIAKLARMMRAAQDASTPKYIKTGGWHLPLFDIFDWDALWDAFPTVNLAELTNLAKKVSAGRCARVSYLTHDGRRSIKEDIELADRLMQSGHWSPFEHVAQALELADQRNGNFIGWRQYRADIDVNFVKITCPHCREAH